VNFQVSIIEKGILFKEFSAGDVSISDGTTFPFFNFGKALRFNEWPEGVL
jgi:hypothetical protein